MVSHSGVAKTWVKGISGVYQGISWISGSEGKVKGKGSQGKGKRVRGYGAKGQML